jgi:hypothetical protein
LAAAVERRVQAATERAEHISESVLTRAFRGELVEPEAELARREGRDFEPAFVLLERIRAERAASTAQTKAKPPHRARARKAPATPEETPEGLEGEGHGDLPDEESAQRERSAKRESRQQEPRTKKEAQPVPIDETDRDEVMAAIREVFSNGAELQRDEAIREIAHQLGYGRVGARIRQALDDDIRTAVRRGILENSLYGLSLLCRSIDEYERDHLIEMLLAAMGTNWWPQDDAIRAAARHLGYRRTGSKIQAAFKSAIRAAIRRGLLERDAKCVRRAK